MDENRRQKNREERRKTGERKQGRERCAVLNHSNFQKLAPLFMSIEIEMT